MYFIAESIFRMQIWIACMKQSWSWARFNNIKSPFFQIRQKCFSWLKVHHYCFSLSNIIRETENLMRLNNWCQLSVHWMKFLKISSCICYIFINPWAWFILFCMKNFFLFPCFFCKSTSLPWYPNIRSQHLWKYQTSFPIIFSS